jgi:hypothetical protein
VRCFIDSCDLLAAHDYLALSGWMTINWLETDNQYLGHQTKSMFFLAIY